VKGACLFDDPQSEFDQIAGQIALNHHERWDGTGYPGHIDLNGYPLPEHTDNHGNARGKKGEEIPIFARIVAVADVYDALSCRRVYKEAWNEDNVLSTIKELSGKKFDPEVVEVFFEGLPFIKAIKEKYPDQENDEENC
jgi:response regulator RpfG family c-di-GMP phosphodiesterase